MRFFEYAVVGSPHLLGVYLSVLVVPAKYGGFNGTLLCIAICHGLGFLFGGNQYIWFTAMAIALVQWFYFFEPVLLRGF